MPAVITQNYSQYRLLLSNKYVWQHHCEGESMSTFNIITGKCINWCTAIFHKIILKQFCLVLILQMFSLYIRRWHCEIWLLVIWAHHNIFEIAVIHLLCLCWLHSLTLCVCMTADLHQAKSDTDSQRLLDRISELITSLHRVQNARLSSQPPSHLSDVSGPSSEESHLGKFSYVLSLKSNLTQRVVIRVGRYRIANIYKPPTHHHHHKRTD